MTVLTPPRPPSVNTALELARRWCAGQVIDQAPAIAHACAVAVTLGRYAPDDATPELVSACLLHDAPEYAPGVLDQAVTDRLGPAVLRLVRSLEAAHHSMAGWLTDPGATRSRLAALREDRPVLVAVGADKIVALASATRRAGRSGDPAGFWAGKPALLAHAPYFRAFLDLTGQRLPATMAAELGGLVARVEAAGSAATAAARAASPRNRSATSRGPGSTATPRRAAP